MTSSDNPSVSRTAHPKILLRSEQSDGRVSVIESVVPAGAGGPPLHTHEPRPTPPARATCSAR